MAEVDWAQAPKGTTHCVSGHVNVPRKYVRSDGTPTFFECWEQRVGTQIYEWTGSAWSWATCVSFIRESIFVRLPNPNHVPEVSHG